jgi:outer membrane protein OmpA-like peptidoglycan-associated protein/uncharacterized protein YidB (DUF937 family)
MAILDSLINESAERYGLGAKAPSVLSALLSLIDNDRTGGLHGFLDRFRQAGMGDQVSSWVNRGANTPITTDQLETALGPEMINRIASNLDVPRASASAALAYMTPRVVDLLTPDGVIPTRLPGWVSSYIGNGRRVGPVGEVARAAPAHRGSILRTLLPLLGLALLGFAGYRYCSRPHEEVARTTVVSPTPATTDMATVNSRLSVSNVNGKINFSGVAPDEQTRQTILNHLRNLFGAENISGDITIDPRAKSAPWLNDLSAALPALKRPGAELSFDGDSINVGGPIAENTRNEMVAKLKSVYGDSFKIGSFDLASAVEGAAERSEAALGALKPGFTAQELTDALNMQVINFASGSAQIPSENVDLLEKSAEAIKAAPAGTVIEIGGYTDNVGDAAANERLSQQRAEAVRNFLIKEGVSPNAVVAEGYGANNPVAGNDTEEGRFRNRRIEYKAL